MFKTVKKICKLVFRAIDLGPYIPTMPPEAYIDNDQLPKGGTGVYLPTVEEPGVALVVRIQACVGHYAYGVGCPAPFIKTNDTEIHRLCTLLIKELKK